MEGPRATQRRGKAAWKQPLATSRIQPRNGQPVKCPTCGTYTKILETRVNPKGIRRRYECANMHRFTTQETLVPTRNHTQLKDKTYDTR